MSVIKEGKLDRATYIKEKEALLVDPITMARIEKPYILSSGTIYDWYTLRLYCSKNPKKNIEGTILDPITLTPLTKSDANTINQRLHDPSFSSLINQATQLCEAAEKNNVEQMQTCIDEDCDLETPNLLNYSPLLLTIKNGAHDCFELLLKSGAKPTAQALMEAADRRQFSMMKRLIEEGADIQAKDLEGNNLLMIILNSDNEQKGQSILEINAAIHFLMETGVDFTHKNAQGSTLLFFAIGSENYQLADELIAKGLDINEKLKTQEDIINGTIPGGTLLTAVAFAAQSANASFSEIIQYMVDNNADLTATNDSGKTALDILREGKRDDLAKIIEAAQMSKPVNPTIFNKVRLGLRACGDIGVKIDDILLELKNFIKYGNKEQAIIDKHQKILSSIVTTLHSLGATSEEQLKSACSKGHPLHKLLLQIQANNIFLTSKSNTWLKESLNTGFDEMKTMMPGKK